MSRSINAWKVWLLTLTLVGGLITLGACAGETGPQGEQGEEGPEGEAGEDGEDGEDGVDGEDGATSLTETEVVEEGEECEAGGVRVNTGIDGNDDGELSEDEVTSSEVVCHSPAADCSAFEITEVSGTDQTFYEGVQSDPITVQHDGDADVEVEFVGSAFAYEAGDQEDETVLTPHEVGGPFQVTVIASNECSVDVDSFVVDEVEPAISTSYAVHLFGAAGEVDVAESGEDDASFTVDYTEADGPVDFEPDTYEFDIIDEDDNVVTTTDSFDLNLGGHYSMVAYPDAVDNPTVDVMQLEDDWSEPSSGQARIQAVNVNPDIDVVDILEVDDNDSATEMFSAVSFGDSANADTFDPDISRLGLDTDESGDADVIFEVGEDAVAEGDTLNLFVYGDDESTGVMLQYLGDAAESHVLSLEPAFEESFEDSDSDLPSDFTTGGDAPWDVDTNEATDGSNSAASEGTPAGGYSYLEFDLDVDSAGELHFDWRTANGSTISDYLNICIDPSGDCMGLGPTEDYITGDTDWTGGSVSLDSAGTYTIVWGVEALNGEFDAWVDNLRFVPE